MVGGKGHGWFVSSTLLADMLYFSCACFGSSVARSLLLFSVMFWFKLLPLVAALILGGLGLLLLIHLASTYSAMGELVLATGAMSTTAGGPVPKEQEERLTPVELTKLLLLQHDLARQAAVPLPQQYRMADYHQHLLREAGLVDELEDVEQGCGGGSEQEQEP